jgi:mRNA-degrading endonuclease YafQ of YafQ-DinJ toxin-antitoxin module
LKIVKVLQELSIDPFNVKLRTHKVESRLYGYVYSSRVSGDLRILWIFEDENDLIVLLLSVGGHSGKHKVYK